MSINDEDTRLPEVEKVPLIIDVEFTEEEHIRSSIEELNPTTTQQTSKPLELPFPSPTPVSYTHLTLPTNREV